MKEIEIDKIVASVQSALGNLDHLHDLTDHIHESVGDLGPRQEHDVEREFQVGVQPELFVTNLVNGSLHIHGSDEAIIRVHAAYGSSHSDDKLPFELTHDGSRVEIRVRGWGHGRSAAYHIEVPRDCSVHAKGVNPDVHVDNLHAAVEVESVGGEINLNDISGDTSLKIVSGSISGQHIAGVLNIHTTSGDATILDSKLHRFVLHSVSGDFTIETPLTAGERYLAHTTSGDLRLIVPGNTNATVQLTSFSGSATSELPTEVIKASRRQWQGRINAGGAWVDMTSSSGDLLIEQGTSTSADVPSDVPATTDVTHVPEPERAVGHTDQQTGDILEALERGDLTVEEAMARLDALQ